MKYVSCVTPRPQVYFSEGVTTILTLRESKQALIDNILINYSDKKIELDKQHPIYSLGLSYSAPHPNAFLSYLSLVSEIATKSGTDQVLIHSNTNGSSYAVYIRRF
ncbi:hypothetical protein GKR50_03235 [Providencia rustigianii]|nr:hypothetical protein [Providencia rustigianii]MTC59029.1 hypothetical protein [Providencia rustigianii]